MHLSARRRKEDHISTFSSAALSQMRKCLGSGESGSVAPGPPGWPCQLLWVCHGPAMGWYGLAWAGFCGRPACCDGRHYRSGRLSVAAVHRHSALRFRSFSSQWHRRARSFQPSLSTSALLTRSPNPLSQPSLRRLSCYLHASESCVGALAYPKTRLRPPFKQGSGFAYKGHNLSPKIRVDQWRSELKTLGRCQLILRGGILDKSFAARNTPSGSLP